MRLLCGLALTLCIRHEPPMPAPTPSDPVIYKIFNLNDWADLVRLGTTNGSAHDQSDGFLHFSTAAQLPGTLETHYRGAGSLILAEIPVEGLIPATLKWEVSRAGALFPHLYAPLSRSQIDRHWTLSPGQDGAYELPDVNGSKTPS